MEKKSTPVTLVLLGCSEVFLGVSYAGTSTPVLLVALVEIKGTFMHKPTRQPMIWSRKFQ